MCARLFLDKRRGGRPYQLQRVTKVGPKLQKEQSRQEWGCQVTLRKARLPRSYRQVHKRYQKDLDSTHVTVKSLDKSEVTARHLAKIFSPSTYSLLGDANLSHYLRVFLDLSRAVQIAGLCRLARPDIVFH